MKKGYTLTELLVTLVIIGIIVALSFPVINRIEYSNNTKKFDVYRKSIIASAKLYVDAYGDDIFGNNDTGWVVISLQDMLDTRVAKDISIDGTDISCNSEETLVKIEKSLKSYKYEVVLGCGKPDGDGVVSNPNIHYPEDKRMQRLTGEIVDVADYVPDANFNGTRSFSGDSWSTIASNVRVGNGCAYEVGSTKTIDMGAFGTHTLRVVNCTKPTECSNSGFSQTACGFVVEFADVVSTYNYNSQSTILGGWSVSEIRTYVNSDIYNALPGDLKKAIISTDVVSGHGSEESLNFTSSDKLYLFSEKELAFDYFDDSALDVTRKLEYYRRHTDMNSHIKRYNGANVNWWLRSVHKNYNRFSFFVRDNGNSGSTIPIYTYGVSPGFRIG